MTKARVSSSRAQSELDKAKKEFKAFDENVKEMTMDHMNTAPKFEQEEQTKLSTKEIDKSKDIYLKPKRNIAGVDPKSGKHEVFNEKFRKDYEFGKEYVQFIAENKEIIGEDIELWTKPFQGVPAELWVVPVNKPVWGPRYLAEQIKRCSYHVLSMDERQIVGGDGLGSYTGKITVDSIKQRLDAHPVSGRKSLFMGSKSF